MRVLDLFSGIGGFSLGLERAGMTTVAFCEVDAKARQVLNKHWPKVPIYDDVQTLTADRLAADGLIPIHLICGGFPCQDLSYAGKGAGLAGSRSGLWFEFHRLIKEIQPAWAIIENVSALRSRGLDEVLRSLAQIGYDAEWHCIPASSLGAPHRRDRIWVIAYPRRQPTQVPTAGQQPAEQMLRGPCQAWRVGPWASRPAPSAVCGMDDGIPHRMDRLKQLGNAVVPQIPELIGRAIMSKVQPEGMQ